MTADVLIVGGGPAGTAAGLALARYSDARVVLVERGRYEARRPGDCLGPGSEALFAHLGVADLLDPPYALPSVAMESRWGGPETGRRDYVTTPFGEGRLVDRPRFDSALADRLAGLGCTVVQGMDLAELEYDRGTWRLRFEGDGGELAVEARALLDATGRRATIGRAMGAQVQRLDRLAAISAVVPQRSRRIAAPFVASRPDGWVYAAPADAGRAVLAFFADSDGIRAWRRDEARLFRETADAEGWDVDLAGAAYAVHPAGSQVLRPVHGDGWVAAGEAAGCFDPLTSMGIGYAMASGAAAAGVLLAQSRGESDGAEAYAASLDGHYREYLTRLRSIYGSERRWSDHPFWRRRLASPPGP